MKRIIRDELTVEELGSKFVVVDRKMWEQEHPTSLQSIVGTTMLAAGPFLTRDEAKAALATL